MPSHRMLRACAALLALVLTPLATPAFATKITYTFAGKGTGSLAGQAFSDTGFTFTVVADTTNMSANIISPVDSVSVAFAGGSTVTLNGRFEIGSGNYCVYLMDLADKGNLITLSLPRETVKLNLLGDFAEKSYGASLYVQKAKTSGGLLTMNTWDTSTASFGTSLAATAAVPEPASWAMMLAGFAVVGATMRRRRRIAVRYA